MAVSDADAYRLVAAPFSIQTTVRRGLGPGPRFLLGDKASDFEND